MLHCWVALLFISYSMVYMCAWYFISINMHAMSKNVHIKSYNSDPRFRSSSGLWFFLKQTSRTINQIWKVKAYANYRDNYGARNAPTLPFGKILKWKAGDCMCCWLSQFQKVKKTSLGYFCFRNKQHCLLQWFNIVVGSFAWQFTIHFKLKVCSQHWSQHDANWHSNAQKFIICSMFLI